MIWIVSDVHGCFYTLQKLLDKVLFADKDAQFVFVGDYVDRGLHNKAVIDLLITLQKQGAICLRGNHDDVVDALLNDHNLHNMREYVVGPPTIRKIFSWWMLNGLDSTLDSYDVVGHRCIRLPPEDIVSEWREKTPQEHKEFFQNLDLYWENDTHFSCHAYMRPNEELPRSLRFMPSDRRVETLWSRFPSRYGSFFPTETQWDKIGVFGHTPTNAVYGSPVPIKYDKIRLIDTGAFTDNYMCAYSCELDDWILQATDPSDKL